MDGDDVLATWFWHFGSGGGYNSGGVEALLRQVAAELHAGRPAEPLIRNAALGTQAVSSYYATSAVDWFLEQLLTGPAKAGASVSRDPWRDLPVANLITRPEVTPPSASPSWKDKRRQGREISSFLAEDCASIWRVFEQLPGTRLYWHGYASGELRTADEQTLASGSGRMDPGSKLSAGGRSFLLQSKRGQDQYADQVIAEIADAGYRDYTGHFATVPVYRSIKDERSAARLRTLVDDAGIPLLYVTGRNFAFKAAARITFPDRRWLRFLLRGTEKANAIMTAVDQTGDNVIRYRKIGSGRDGMTEVAVRPALVLTEELLLAIAVSAQWLDGYFMGVEGPAPKRVHARSLTDRRDG